MRSPAVFRHALPDRDVAAGDLHHGRAKANAIRPSARARNASRSQCSIRLRFVPAGGRALSALRAGTVDVVWPVPADLLRKILELEARVGNVPTRGGA